MKKYLYHDELAPEGRIFDHDVELDEEWVDSPALLKSFIAKEKAKAEEIDALAEKKAAVEARIEAAKVKRAKVEEEKAEEIVEEKKKSKKAKEA